MSPESVRTLVEKVARVLGPATGGAAEVRENYDHPTAVVPPEQWIAALTAARDGLGATFFDWLTGVVELADGYTVAAFVCAPADAPSGESAARFNRGEGLLLKTLVPRDQEWEYDDES